MMELEQMYEGRLPEVAGGQPDEPVDASRRPAPLPVLIVFHAHDSSAGHVGQWFRRTGHRLDVRRPFAGDPLPATLRGHCGAVIFGGPQSANDASDHIRREIDWIGLALEEHKPFLGICLGAQMLARQLGARVEHCPMGTVEIGYHPIRPTEAGRGLGFPGHVYHWHREGFDLPRHARLLATADSAYPNQAFCYGSAVGLQFHPEITFAQVSRWSGSNRVRLLLRGARSRQEQIDTHLIEAPKVHRWLDGFLGSWIAGALARV